MKNRKCYDLFSFSVTCGLAEAKLLAALQVHQRLKSLEIMRIDHIARQQAMKDVIKFI